LSGPPVRLYLSGGTATDEDGMAASAMDPLYTEHYRTWLGFTRLIRYVLVFLVILLAGMGYFLT
jgi:hypothetical protein